MNRKDHWIQETLESLDQSQQAEANPYLYNKIISRIQAGEQPVSLFKKQTILKLSVGFVILLLLNLAAIKKYNSQRKGDLSNTAASTEYFYQFNYNY